jgi:peptidylprolyl isomerase
MDRRVKTNYFGWRWALAIVAVFSGANSVAESPPKLRSPYTIVADAPADHWRTMAPENSLYFELAVGTVVVELLPEIAPAHSDNLRALVREGFYDGLSIYRVVDGFVAQGGADDKRQPRQAKAKLAAEFEHTGDLGLSFYTVERDDGFAAESGFVRGFAAGRDTDTQWLLHCPGAFAFARNDAPDSGGTEFYMVLGQAPRYLDRNVTVLGAVRYGMESLQRLNRGTDASGTLEPERRNPIVRVRVGSDVPASERIALQIMDTNSASFSELVRSRAHRPEPWFVHRPGYVDTCGVPVPTRVAP